jgi:hypothetical protein
MTPQGEEIFDEIDPEIIVQDFDVEYERDLAAGTIIHEPHVRDRVEVGDELRRITDQLHELLEMINATYLNHVDENEDYNRLAREEDEMNRINRMIFNARDYVIDRHAPSMNYAC